MLTCVAPQEMIIRSFFSSDYVRQRMQEPAQQPPIEANRANARREQILCAAAQCFREHGFHAASINKISALAGMSPGHIYHYFANKETIIAAIVARDLEVLQALSTELRATGDLRSSFVERASASVSDHLDPAFAGLKIEIVAEAARNPDIAAIVRAAEETSRSELVRTIKDIRRSDGHPDDPANTEAITEIMICLFEGMLVRAIRNPDVDQAMLSRWMRRTIISLLDQTA